MDVTLCVAFGSRERAVVWAGSYQTEFAPTPGQSTEIHLHSQPDARDEDPESIFAEVVHAETEDDGTTIVFLYAGEQLPDDHICMLLEASQWVPMNAVQARDVMEIVDAAPPMAHTHDVLLVVGDLEAKDEDGNPTFESWNRAIIPDDPVIPMFGERLYVDVLDALPSDDEEDESDDEDEDLSDSPTLVGLQMIANEDDTGSAATGLPAVVFYAAKVDPGEAQVGFWVSSLGDVSGFDLVAAGWQKMTPDIFDPIEFRLGERVDLARRTRIDSDVDDDGQLFLKDFELRDAARVEESQYELLPSALVNHCKAAKEMLGIDDIVSGWLDEQSDDTK